MCSCIVHSVDVSQTFLNKSVLRMSSDGYSVSDTVWDIYKYVCQLFCECISAVVHSFVMNSISAVAQAEGSQIPPDPHKNTIIPCWFIHQGEYSVHFHSQANFSPPLLHYLFVCLYVFYYNQKI